MQETEFEEYCKYCGEDAEKGHSENCPLVNGIRVSKEGYIAFGFKADPFDKELNLHTARMGTLLALRESDIGPTDKKIGGRLAYEHLKSELERDAMHIMNLINQKNKSFNPIKRVLIQRKINKLKKQKEVIKKLGDGWSKKYGEAFPSKKFEVLIDLI